MSKDTHDGGAKNQRGPQRITPQVALVLIRRVTRF